MAFASITIISTYINYMTLALFGYLNEFWARLTAAQQLVKEGYAPLLKSFEDFYTRNFFRRVQDCWNRPICSNAGAWFDVMERESNDFNRTLKLTGKTKRCLNVSSYNYLGFADNSDYCTEHVLAAVDKYGVASGSSAVDFGHHKVVQELEALVARFVGKEDAIVCGMGFATNSTCIPLICGPGTLIISDSLNHSSIVTGARSSGAKVKVFKHNDVVSLENVIRESISQGQPRTRRPWKKIFIVIEGIYSMEGETAKLNEIVALKKKYKCYLYVDEAHSIGALGERGKGICDYCNVDPADVDILMGTFTKSFGSVGGYIASSRALISYLRQASWHRLYGTSMPAPSAQQALSAMKIILGEDGTSLGQRKLTVLKENANFFRESLIKMGFEVFGERDSPVIPLMLYNPSKVIAFSRECFERGLAVVVVGFPATSLIASRVRFCISAGHSMDDLKAALQVIDEVGDIAMVKYAKYGRNHTGIH